jgi:hypothetical protein
VVSGEIEERIGHAGSVMTGTPLQKRLARQMSKSRAEGFVRAS